MDLSHSGCHLPGRLAVLVLRDGDKTPVSSARIGGGLPSGGRGSGVVGGGPVRGEGFPEMLGCFAIMQPS